MLNMMVFAAMPTESVSTTNSAKNGDLASRRTAYQQSCQTVSIDTRPPTDPKERSPAVSTGSPFSRTQARLQKTRWFELNQKTGASEGDGFSTCSIVGRERAGTDIISA